MDKGLTSEKDLTCDFSELPEEVVWYAFDQLQDRRLKDIELLLPEEAVKINHSAARIEESPMVKLLQTAFNEKINDMEWEIDHGERHDYTNEEIKNMRNTVTDVCDIAVELCLFEVPDNYVEYLQEVFPQKEPQDLLDEKRRELSENDQYGFDYEEKKFWMNETIYTSRIRELLHEYNEKSE